MCLSVSTELSYQPLDRYCSPLQGIFSQIPERFITILYGYRIQLPTSKVPQRPPSSQPLVTDKEQANENLAVLLVQKVYRFWYEIANIFSFLSHNELLNRIISIYQGLAGNPAIFNFQPDIGYLNYLNTRYPADF